MTSERQDTAFSDAITSDGESSEEKVLQKEESLQQAFANGTYPEWLARQALQESQSPHILQDITRELEGMKKLSPEQRMEDYNWIVRYYSRSNKGFEDTSLKLADHIGCPEEDIRSGAYDSESVASHLLLQLKEYDALCVVPIIKQVRDYLIQNFPNTNILFLGRDFCSAYLYIVNDPVLGETVPEGINALKRENVFLSNISRYVRDVAIGGKATELRMVLERVGLTKDVLLKKGLLIADSCMQGKIPAIILKSLALGMNEMERLHFLTHSHVRYLKSSRTKGDTIAHKAAALAACNPGMGLRDVDLETLLSDKLDMIEEFKVDYPAFVQEYYPRRHKLFEWRPKLALIAMGIEVGPEYGGASLVANEPKTPSEKILSLMGLYGEIQFLKAAREAASTNTAAIRTAPPEHGDFNAQKMAMEIALLPTSKRVGQLVVSSSQTYHKPPPLAPGWFLKEIDNALQDGVEGLRKWQDEADPSNVGSVAVMRTKDLSLPYELVINGKVIYRFKDIVGEGNNVKVYLTEDGTIVKVIKNAKHVRKNLLLAWAEPFVREAGIQTAKVLNVSETGLYLEQEAVPGESLEAQFANAADGAQIDAVPSRVREMAIQDFHAAKKLIATKGIWLDLKSANYHIDNAGKLVNVDYAPRVNPTYYRYFQADPDPVPLTETVETIGQEIVTSTPLALRRDLTDAEFLETFFNHDVKKRCKKLTGKK